MKVRLVWKLLAVNVLVVGLAMLVVGVAVDVLASQYFMTLVEKYDIAPAKAHGMFVEAVRRYLFRAGLLACGAAAALSYWLTRRILVPLGQMQQSAARIAAGDFTAEVRRTSHDEVGELADAFNHMTHSLLRIERLRREMVANVAHELRTPLTNIRGYLEGLIDGVVPPTSATFVSLHEETLRLVTLTEDALHLARADMAPLSRERVAVRLDVSVAQAVELFRLRFAEKRLTVETDLAAAAVSVLAEEGRTCQIIINLLENAWRYTPAGGRVRVTAARLEGWARITVSNDAGTLVSPDISLLFERFYRGEKSRSREFGGAGIGLSIVKELVETHGGRVGGELASGIVHVWFELPVFENAATPELK